MTENKRYVPAAGRAWLTTLYDPAMALTMRERAFRPALVEAALAGRPQNILDVGCGTGTLVAMLASADADVRIHGVDGDHTVLARARERTAAVRDRVELSHALADALPVEDQSLDVVTSSLLLHHLVTEDKLRALGEFRRVLRPGGRVVIADWGAPHDPVMRGAFLVLQLLDGFANTRDHAAGRLPSLIGDAGFVGLSVTRRWRTVWGSLELIVAEAQGSLA